MVLAMFVIWGFSMLRYDPSIPSFFGAFIMRNVEFCPRPFLYLLEWSCDFYRWFYFCAITFIDLHMLNHLCIPRMKPTWSWCIVFFFPPRVVFLTVTPEGRKGLWRRLGREF
jgi:hypothetical protein